MSEVGKKRGFPLFPALLVTVLFLGSLCCYQLAGVQMDDYGYLHEFHSTGYEDESFLRCEGEEITTLPQVIESIRLHNIYWTNARLGSAILFAANLWPLWLTETLNAVALSLMFLLILRMSLGRSWVRRPLCSMGIVLMVWWAMPWHEYMLASAFAINYLWATCLNLWLLLLLMRGRGKLWAVSLLAFVASMMHEGIAIPMDLLLFCYCVQLLVRRGWNTRFMVPCIIYAIGSLLVLLAPSVWMRSGEGEVLLLSFWLRRVVQILVYKYWTFTALVLLQPLIMLRLKKRVYRRYILIVWPMIVASFAGFLEIYISSKFFLRSGWMGYVISIIGLGIFLRYVHLPGRVVKRAVALVLLAAMAVWMGGLAVWQYKIRKQIDYITEKYMSQGEALIYCDVTTPMELPWWTLNIPVTYSDSNMWLSYHLINKKTGEKKGVQGKLINILPAGDTLRRWSDYPLVAGTAGLRQINASTFYCEKPHKNFMNITFGEAYEGGEAGEALPWYELRKKFGEHPFRHSDKYYFMRRPMAVSEKMRARGVAPEGVDSVYFFEIEYFSIYRILRGSPIIRIDSIENHPKK